MPNRTKIACNSCENVFSVGRLAPRLDNSDGDHSNSEGGSWLCPACVAADSQPGLSHNCVRSQHTGCTWLEVLRRLESESGAYGPCSCHDSELSRRMRVMFVTAALTDHVDVRKPHRSRAPAPRVAVCPHCDKRDVPQLHVEGCALLHELARANEGAMRDRRLANRLETAVEGQ